MKFHRVVGKQDANLISKAEEALTKVFLDLAVRPSSEHLGSSLGGDPLLFSLLCPMQHVATTNIPTAATDGKRYYWNPKFVLSKSVVGLRIVCAHEAWHAIYMHPTRRGSRNPKLWNIAVDFIVNSTIMRDLKHRKFDPEKTFAKELGNFVTLKNYAAHLQNPFAPIPGSESWVPEPEDSTKESITLPPASEERELTDKEKKELADRESKIMYFFADPDLPEDLRKPEKIYDYLYSLLPKCPTCGRIGIYKLPKDKDEESEEKEDDCCSGGYDIFDFGSTLDDHMDATESPEETAKRIAGAMESAKRMAGSVPAELEDELSTLISPIVRWQDFIRAKITKTRDGNSRNDWTRFRSRPLFAGLMKPKRINKVCTFGCLLDTSGSMNIENDITFGISQLQSIDDRSEGWVVPADATIYWQDATKLKSVKAQEICKIKVKGRGGTKYAEFFSDYEKHMGKVDFLILITDGFLDMTDVAAMLDPGVDVVWLITQNSNFKPPFGRCFELKAM